MSYDLSRLSPNEFESLVNFLALHTLGLGVTSFAPGADGGRDGYFEGEAPYPSKTNCWKGTWFIQSKFHAPHLSKDSQTWLLQQVESEISAFNSHESDRQWPDIWILATNIDPSGKATTGTFDKIKKKVAKATSRRGTKFAVWGGKKIIQMLAMHPDVASYFAHVLTPGHVITAIYDALNDERASIEEIVRYLVVSQFGDHTFTKLDQAGSSTDMRPAVHDLFIDLPFACGNEKNSRILSTLVQSSAQVHRYSVRKIIPESWRSWSLHPRRARVALIKGGPGQGKSTVGQYLCQIQRAALMLTPSGPPTSVQQRAIAEAIRRAAISENYWPSAPRVPIQIELKEYAHWFSERKASEATNVLSYVAAVAAKRIGSQVHAKTIRRALSKGAWIVIFDGLDEVPNDHKDAIAAEVLTFVSDTLIACDADVLTLCTSRPQGYSGQFSGMDGPVIDLSPLDIETALRCARPVLVFGRANDESNVSIKTLESASHSPNVRELMTTPLQSHIMAVVVRDGGRPPERRWQLFNSFYLTMKKRESQKNFYNPRIERLLREGDRLLRSVHNRLGFVLHARAETSAGAQTTLSKKEFRELVRDAVAQLVEVGIDETVNDVMEATTERLVLVSTPESGESVRFDIRQLQEFFAAEFLYSNVDALEIGNRLRTIGADAHWREVVHFILSALIENQRGAEFAVAVQVLRTLDESDDPENRGTFARRMARSAFLAVRLLVEGVLEQDQRDRQGIAPLLVPLGGIVELRSLDGLARLPMRATRQWLVQGLFNSLSTASKQETLGSLYLLGILDSNEEHEDALRAAFSDLPSQARFFILKNWAHFAESKRYRTKAEEPPEDTSLARWVVQISVNELNADTCSVNSTDFLRNLISVAVSSKENFVLAISRLGLSSEISRSLIDCLAWSPYRHLRSSRDLKGKVRDCGLLRASLMPEGWLEREEPKTFKSIDARAYTAQTRGIFSLIFSLLSYSQNQDRASLDVLIERMESLGTAVLRTQLGSFALLAPIAGVHAEKSLSIEPAKSLRKLPDVRKGASEMARRGEISNFYDFDIVRRRRASAANWRRAAEEIPGFAAYAAFCGEELGWARPQTVDAILRQVIERNAHSFGSLVLQWGALKASAPDLLELIKAKCELEPTNRHEFVFGPRRTIHAFPFSFPADIRLLGVFARAVVERVCDDGDEFLYAAIDDQKEMTPLQYLTSFSISPNDVREIMLDTSALAHARAGAAALYWLIATDRGRGEAGESAAELDLLSELSLFERLLNEHNRGWLSRAFVWGTLTPQSENNRNACIAVNKLLSLPGESSWVAAEVAHLLRTWRERSRAPVNTNGTLQPWLGYVFTAPTYAR